MDLRPTNGDEKLPVEPYDPWQSRDRKGADDSPNFRPFFKGVEVKSSHPHQTLPSLCPQPIGSSTSLGFPDAPAEQDQPSQAEPKRQ